MKVDIKKLETFVKKNPTVEFIKCQFSDIQGNIREVTLTIEALLGSGVTSVDGSSAFGKIIPPTESEMILVPDYETLVLVSWTKDTARVICNVFYPPEEEGAPMLPFEGCGRNILAKVIADMEKTLTPIVQKMYSSRKIKNIRAYFAPEVEFMLIPESYDIAKLPTDSNIKNDHYFGTLSEEEDEALKDMVRHLGAMGLKKEKYHAEVATYQFEIGIGHSNALAIADGIMTIKSVIQNIARRHGFKASLIPKFNSLVNGSGMHFHVNFSVTFTNGEEVNLFFDPKMEFGLSLIGRKSIAGLAKYESEITAFTNPLPISYKRLVPGAEAPTRNAIGKKNRTASKRLPAIGTKKIRVEYRPPDPRCNPYLGEAAILSAMVAGIKENLKMPAFDERNLYVDNAGTKELPGNLVKSLKIMHKSTMLRESMGNFIVDTVFNLGMQKNGKRKFSKKVTAEDVVENF